MVESSKMDKMLLTGFSYDGKIKSYLTELDFKDARSVFMARYRMLPSKSNFPGRWIGELCNVCGIKDTDRHIFRCPGYMDLAKGIEYEMFFDDKIIKDSNKLKELASKLTRIIKRMESIKELDAKENTSNYYSEYNK